MNKIHYTMVNSYKWYILLICTFFLQTAYAEKLPLSTVCDKTRVDNAITQYKQFRSRQLKNCKKGQDNHRRLYSKLNVEIQKKEFRELIADYRNGVVSSSFFEDKFFEAKKRAFDYFGTVTTSIHYSYSSDLSQTTPQLAKALENLSSDQFPVILLSSEIYNDLAAKNSLMISIISLPNGKKTEITEYPSPDRNCDILKKSDTSLENLVSMGLLDRVCVTTGDKICQAKEFQKANGFPSKAVMPNLSDIFNQRIYSSKQVGVNYKKLAEKFRPYCAKDVSKLLQSYQRLAKACSLGEKYFLDWVKKIKKNKLELLRSYFDNYLDCQIDDNTLSNLVDKSFEPFFSDGGYNKNSIAGQSYSEKVKNDLHAIIDGEYESYGGKHRLVRITGKISKRWIDHYDRSGGGLYPDYHYKDYGELEIKINFITGEVTVNDLSEKKGLECATVKVSPFEYIKEQIDANCIPEDIDVSDKDRSNIKPSVIPTRNDDSSSDRKVLELE